MDLKQFIEDRIFYSPDGCWYWTGYVNDAGYGVIDIDRRLPNRKTLRASRASFELYKEPIIGNNEICHTCDNPICINPNHLFQASHTDNMIDMVKKGRSPKGSRHGHSILHETDIPQIRKMLKDNVPFKEIANIFSISVTSVYDIRRGSTWSHI